MPTDMSRYPDNWAEIRNNILVRAGGQSDAPRIGAKCEWCGIENYSVKVGGNVVRVAVSYRDAMSIKADGLPTASIVVLTIAHLADPDPMNCDPDNLAALCQKCHNGYDAAMRRHNRQVGAIKKQIDSGQMRLPLEMV